VSVSSRHPLGIVAVFVAVLAALVPAAGPLADARWQPHQYTAVHMGMPVRIVLYADEPAAASAARAAFARVAALDAMMSDYRADSEVRQLGRAPVSWVRVSPELFAVLDRAVEVARASDGAFDPTVGPLVALWRESRSTGRLPDRNALRAARALVGWRRLGLDRGRHAARLAIPGMRLDLGGIAKGYILQEALQVLRTCDAPRALIEAGGDVVVGDAPPDRAGWRIDTPGANLAFAARAAALTNSAFATSGPTAQFVVIAGVRYSHIVDPHTGLGVTHNLTARVIAGDGATADAVATALSVLGPEGARGLPIASLPGVFTSYTSTNSPLSDKRSP